MDYCNSGQRWTDEEDEKLDRLYNVEKKDIGHICKEHKRFLGGITTRLQSKNYILIPEEARGYNDFIISEEYKCMKRSKQGLQEKRIQEKMERSNNKTKNKNNSYLITINQEDYNNLKESNDELKNMFNELSSELSGIKYNLKELKDMIKNLAIYDFD
tara:strand:+ start:2246 stop:2719 length:474 start_codon:yes stop_codon:yes gene_type:complete